MAVGTSTSYFSNAIIGVPQVGADVDIHQVDLTPKFAVGFGFARADGNKYRYCHFGADTNRGLVVQTQPTESHSGQPELHKGAAGSNLVKVAGETMNPSAIGSHYIQCSMTAVAHQFAGGYATITSGSGLGYTYRIKDNTVTGSPVAGEVYLQLYKPLVVAIKTNSGIAIAGCQYSNLEVCTNTGSPIGVTVSGVSDTNYAWICTQGVTSILQDTSQKEAVGYGSPVFLSSSTAGAVRYEPNLAVVLATGTGLSIWPRVGNYVLCGTYSTYSTVALRLE